MTTDDRWQQIETLLRKDRKSRTARQAEQLRAHVEELLSTPEGRKSIQDRFGDSRPFQGKGWFLNEVVRTVDGAKVKAAALTSSERQDLLLGLLPHARPAVDAAHWNILWILLQDGHVHAGQMALESLGKLGSRREELPRILVNAQAWQYLAKDRAAALLEAARQAARSRDEGERLERAVTWARSRTAPTQQGPGDRTAAVPAEPPGQSPQSIVAPDPAAMKDGEAPSVPMPETAGRQEESRTDSGPPSTEERRRPGRSARGPARPPAVEGERDELSECLSEVGRLIEGLQRRQGERLCQAESEAAAAKAANAQLHEQLERTVNELQAAQGRLQRETEIAEELRREKIRLEERLVEREHELASSRGEMQKLTHLLSEARQEIEAARRRAEDYIHHAGRDRDSAVRTFQSHLWEELQYYLLEVLEEEPDPPSLNEDQKMFRRRLREIKAVLRDKGVPPV
jgi:hypothetical protein